MSTPPEGKEVSFEPIQEGWSTYKTRDVIGAIIKLKLIVVKVILTGINDIGSPQFAAGGNVIVTVSVPADKKGDRATRQYTDAEIVDSIVEHDVSFDVVKEDWNQFKLEDDVVVSMKVIATQISRTDKYDMNGDPLYYVHHQTITKGTVTKEVRAKLLAQRATLLR